MNDLQAQGNPANSLVVDGRAGVPALFAGSSQAAEGYIEFLVASIRNPNTREAYARALVRFSAWCERHGLALEQLRAVHVATYIEEMQQRDGLAAATVKQALAAISVLCDHLVVRQVLTGNPASAVRAPKIVRRVGTTPVLDGVEARQLLTQFDASTLWGLRNRALVATMIYTFARVRAALLLKVGDYEVRGRRGYLRLQEKGGKLIDAPCHHELDGYLEEWLEVSGLAGKRKHALFPSIPGGKTIIDRPLSAVTAWSMVQAKAKAAGLGRHITNHSFRATGITAYLRNGGKLEVAQYLAGHADPSTTQLYDRRKEDVAVSEVERILL